MAHAPVVVRSYVAFQQVIAGYGTFDAGTARRSPWSSATSTARRHRAAASRPGWLQRQVRRNHVFVT